MKFQTKNPDPCAETRQIHKLGFRRWPVVFVLISYLCGISFVLGSNYKTDPVRLCKGIVYDLTPAIEWYETRLSIERNKPDLHSPLMRDWELRKRNNDLQGQKWKRFLLEGRISERREQGVIINAPTTKSVQSGSVKVDRYTYAPRYTTVRTTKPLLLLNAPTNSFSLPLFAIPVGSTTLRPAGVLVEAFDYGVPLRRHSETSKTSKTSSRTRSPQESKQLHGKVGIAATNASKPAVGQVVAIVDHSTVIVSLGSNHGFKAGEKLMLCQPLETRDQKGVRVFTEEKIIGELRLQVVQESQSKAIHQITNEVQAGWIVKSIPAN